jgi:hypothetical protein
MWPAYVNFSHLTTCPAFPQALLDSIPATPALAAGPAPTAYCPAARGRVLASLAQEVFAVRWPSFVGLFGEPNKSLINNVWVLQGLSTSNLQ